MDIIEKYYKKILVIGLLILAILFIWKAIQEASGYNRIKLSENNIVRNESEYSFADTTLSVALDVAEIHGVRVLIRDLTPEISQTFSEQNGGLELQATIIGKGNQYILYVYNLDRVNAIQTMAHEVLHLMQYHSGRLQLLPPSTVVWEGDTLTKEEMYNIQYTQRPWEIEAFRNEDVLTSEIRKILYGKNM